MFDQDDFHTDNWFSLYDRHVEFFDWLDEQMGAVDPNWDVNLDEPSAEEWEIINHTAQDLLLDILGE